MTERIKSGMDDLANGRINPMTDFSKLSDGEIDRLVAEALGWKKDIAITGLEYWYMPGVDPKLYPTSWRDIPNFTTDPDAREQLLEKMPDKIQIDDKFVGQQWHYFTIEKYQTEWFVGFKDDVEYENNSFHDDYFCRGKLGRCIAECFLKATEVGK